MRSARVIRHVRAQRCWRGGTTRAGAGAVLFVVPVGAALSVAAVAYAHFPGRGDATVTVSVGAPEIAATAGQGSGQYPGAPATTIPVTIRNGGGAPVVVEAIRPRLQGLPASCPASAWQIAAPSSLPTVAPSTSVMVGLTVAMAPDAPSTCQGATVTVPVTVEGAAR